VKISFLTFALFSFLETSSSYANESQSNWSCGYSINHNKHRLHCGGAFIGDYQSAIECVQARKQICGTSGGDYSCHWGIGYEFVELTCGGAYIGRYKNPIACVKAKRAICD
jgi:hypothetical protein